MFAAQRLRLVRNRVITPGSITINPSSQTTASQGPWGTSGGTMSLGNNVTAGNGVLAVLSTSSNDSDVFGPITGCGVTFSQEVNNSFSALWWGNGSSGGSKTITVDDTYNRWLGAAIEIAGVVGGPIATAVGTDSGSYQTTVTVTPTVSGQLAIVACVGNYSGSSNSPITTGAGWTVISPSAGFCQFAYQIATGTSPLTATFTNSSLGPISSFGLVFV